MMIHKKDTFPTRQSKIKRRVKCLDIELWRARHISINKHWQYNNKEKIMNNGGTMAIANTAIIVDDSDEQYDVEDTNFHTSKDISSGVMVGLVDDNDDDDILAHRNRTQQQSEVDYSRYRYYYGTTSSSMREEGEVVCPPCFVNSMASILLKEDGNGTVLGTCIMIISLIIVGGIYYKYKK